MSVYLGASIPDWTLGVSPLLLPSVARDEAGAVLWSGSVLSAFVPVQRSREPQSRRVASRSRSLSNYCSWPNCTRAPATLVTP